MGPALGAPDVYAAGGFGLFGTFLTLGFANRNTRLTIGAACEANEAELAAIGAKLDSFYGPYLQRSEDNRPLACGLQARQPEGFRTLVSLMSPGWFEGLATAGKTIVDEIVANGLDLRDTIRQRVGSVDPVILPYLARASTHFTVLKLARSGSLDGDPHRFRRFVHPRQPDPMLSVDMRRLVARVARFQSQLLVNYRLLAPLSIPAELALDPDTDENVMAPPEVGGFPSTSQVEVRG